MNTSKTSAILLFMGGLLCAAALQGCSTTPVTIRPFNKDGEPVVEKRYAKNMARDFVHRFSKTAYAIPSDSDFAEFIAPDEHRVLAEVGRPDLKRFPFKSRENELVDEWIYLKQQYMAQFIEGVLVYEGPLSDYERVLMEHGYPRLATEVKVEGGGEIVHWVYRDPMQGKGKTFAFNNDKLCLDLLYH